MSRSPVTKPANDDPIRQTPQRNKPRSGHVWLIALAFASLLSALYLMITPGDNVSERTVAANGYSRSAIGHLGLIKLLEALDERVMRRRSRAVGRAGLLVLAEPSVPPDEQDRLAECMDWATETLVVLPKRTAFTDPDRTTWARDSGLVELSDVTEMLENLPTSNFPEVLRVDEVRTWQSDPALPAPTIPGPVQLFAHDDRIAPLISCRDGVLLGYVDDSYDTWVLSDPDVIANHGLLRGDNAALAVAILKRLCPDGSIEFDESLHGFAREPSIYHLAGQFPAVIITVHLLLMMALVAFAALGRFGPVAHAATAIASGKAYLIENVVALQRRAGHHDDSLRRYGWMCIRHAALRLRAPKGLDSEQGLQWLLQREPDEQSRSELQRLVTHRHHARTERDATRAARRIKELTERIGNAS